MSATTDWPPRPARSPLLIPAAIIAVVLLTAGIVFAATRDGGDSSSASSGTLVRYDVNADKVELLDGAGKVTKTFDGPGDDNATMFMGPKGTVLFDGDKRFGVMDLAGGSITSYDIPDGYVLASRPAVDSTRLTFFDPVGGDVLIIDIGSSKLVSARDVVDDAAGEYVSTRGFPTAQAFTDVKSDPPHTLIVPNNGDDPWLVDGGVLDTDGNRSLAATFGSADSTVSIFDRDKQVDTASLDMAVIGGLLTGDHAATIVSADGKVSSVDMKGGITKDITDLEVEPGFAIAMTHDRMFVAGHDDTSYLIDAAGATVRSFDPAQDGDGNAEAVSFVANGYVPGARCFITQAGSGIVRGGKIDVRTVVDGKSVAQLSTTGVLAVTPDGCTAIGLSGDSADLVLDGKEKDLGRDATVTALSPDLRQAVISGGNGFQLVDIASGRTTDLDRGLYTYAVVAD